LTLAMMRFGSAVQTKVFGASLFSSMKTI